MVLTARGLTAWTLLNVVAAAAFVWLASWTWLEPNLRGEEVARGGDALVWMTGAAPILGLSLGGNAVWLALVRQERRRGGFGWPVGTIITIAAIWISVLFVDHFRGLGF
jgi:hypothetical protein